MMNTFDGIRAMDPRSCQLFIPLVVLFDRSGSMTIRLAGSLSARYPAAVNCLIRSLRLLAADDLLCDNVFLFIYTFHQGRVEPIRLAVPLAELNLTALEQELLALDCAGNTPMGTAINKALDDMEEVKQVAKETGMNYAQPLMAIISDSEANDDMTAAMRRIQSLTDMRKLTVLPFAIGNSGDRFPTFEKMTSFQGGELQVLTSESDIRRHFRILNQTVSLIQKDINFTPMSDFGAADKD